MPGDKIFIDHLNRKFRIPAPKNLIKPPDDIQFASKSKQWKLSVSYTDLTMTSKREIVHT